MKLHLPKALAAAVMALFAIPDALADTVTVTIDGTQYAGTTVVTSAPTSEPSEGSYVLFNLDSSSLDSDGFYSIKGATSWIYNTTKTLIGASCSDSNGINYTGTKFFFDTGANGKMTVNADIVVGSASGVTRDDIRFWNQATESSTIILKGSIKLVNSTTQIWNEKGTQYLEGAINGEGKTLKIVGLTSSALLRLSGGGTIGTLNSAQAGGSVTLSATDQDGTAAASTEYTITTMASGNSTAALTVESGVTLHLTNLNAGKLVNGGTLNLTDYNAGTLSNTGTVNLTNFNGGTLTNGGTLNLTDYNAGTLSNTDTVNLTNFNGGTLTNEGTLNLTNYKSGTLTNSGTVKFASSSSLGTMLSVGGSLDLSAITSLNVDAADSKNFTRLGSLPTSNGYYKGDIALIGYSGDGEVSIGSITGTGWLDGATITYDSTNKRLTASIVADSGVYCVVTDTNTTDNTALSAEETSLIALGNSAVLGLNAGWNDLKGIDSSGGTINIASGASLSSANLRASATTTITGSGRYTTSSMTSYGTNVSLSDDWTGNLVISGATIIGNNGHNIDTFGKKSSLVTLQGVTGHLASGATVTKNLELSKSGTQNGMTIDNGYTDEQDDAKLQFTLSGAISGNGDLEISKGSATNQSPMAYALTGDLSAWTGYFVTSANYSTTDDAI
ncbi:MAG: beta strand repeat-containing protein, partial [Akkermansia sp.]